jgi:putative sigma-54 modulation protein
MTVEFAGRHVEVTPRLRALAQERALRLERHLGGPADVRVVLTHEKHRFGAEVIAKHRRKLWTAQEENSDVQSAVVMAFEKVAAQAKKDSGRRHDRKHRGGAEALPLRQASGPTPGDGRRRRDEPKRSPMDEAQQRVVRVARRTAARPMSVEEAAMRIESARDEVVVFRDSGSEKLSVLYRKRNGEFGLIVPEC